MTRVMVAVDGSAASVRAARRAVELFGATAEYLVVNVAATPEVFPESVTFGGVFPMSGDEWQHVTDAAEQGAQTTTDQVVAAAGIEPSEVVVEHGDPVEAIGRAADEHDADVIVVGRHRRSWLGRLFDPSVSDAVVRHANRAVLVVAGD